MEVIDRDVKPETTTVCTALACDAGGDPKDGGHVFESDPAEPGNGFCRCGMDAITYTCWFVSF